jgi:hypothetical protein
LVATQVFLWTTLLLFAFGPWQWPLSDPGKLYAFVVAAHIALLLGYLSAAHRNPAEGATTFDPRKLLTASLWATLLVLPLTSYARTGQWIPDILGAIRNPGLAYQEAHLYAEGGANFASYLRVLAAPALAILFPVGVFYWSRWTWPVRLTMLSAMGSVVLLAVGTGQRRDIADLLITVPFLVAASHFAGVTRLSRRTLVLGTAGICVAVVTFSAYFIYSHVSRVGHDTARYGANPVTQQMPNLDNPLLQVLPDEARPGAVGLLNYLTTGYFGLGLALERPVKPMWGMGHSMFLTRNFQKLANDDGFERRSLPVQISDKDGFRYPVFWCTAYPYFANDLGFLGVVAMLFFVGRGLALSWIDMLSGRNAAASVMFGLLLTLVFYLPATNRMLQDGEGVAAVYFWLAAWIAGRSQAVWKRRSPCPIPA